MKEENAKRIQRIREVLDRIEKLLAEFKQKVKEVRK